MKSWALSAKRSSLLSGEGMTGEYDVSEKTADLDV